MRYIPFLLIAALLVLVSSCHQSASRNHELEIIDSLMSQQDNQEALRRLSVIPTDVLNDNDKAYYELLSTMVNYKNDVAFVNDSIISHAVDYYHKKKDLELYMRALIAQGCVNEDMGNYDKAVECFHQAEVLTSTGDTSNIAYAKLHLGTIYNESYIGTQTLALQKYREALSLYQAAGDKHYTLVCMSDVGHLYRNDEEKYDSAVMYLKQACKLAKTDKDPYFIFANHFSLSEYYLVREQDYRTSIRYGRQALSADPSVIEHPRAHFRLAECYLQLGQMDSALYYLNTAPQMTQAVDSIVYFDVMSKVEHAKHNEGASKHYLELAHEIADSVAYHGMNERLLAVEKKYDLQQQELKNSQLQSRLRGSWLVLAAIAIAALLLLMGLMHYRNRLRLKEHEQELMRADLDASLTGLQRMQGLLEDYERKLQASETACREQMTANETLEQESQRLNAAIDTLEDKKRQSDELRAIITQQIESVNELMTWSYQHNADIFTRKFREKMTIPTDGTSRESYWKNLHALVNELHNNVLVRAQETAGGTLNDSELNLLALYCCGFSRTVIMVTMGYNHIGTVYNKKNQIASKLGVNDLNDFVNLAPPSDF